MEERVRELKLLSRPGQESLDIGKQLEDLRNLKDGWADGVQTADKWGDGYGKAPKTQGIDWLYAKFRKSYQGDLPLPYVYPTPEGNVSLEWSIERNEASLEIDLETHSGEWHCLDLTTGSSTEEIIDLDDEDGWERLGLKISRLGIQGE